MFETTFWVETKSPIGAIILLPRHLCRGLKGILQPKADQPPPRKRQPTVSATGKNPGMAIGLKPTKREKHSFASS
jgi:hypothetical protein